MRFFNISEFDSPDQPGSGAKMDQGFLDLLDDIRFDAGIPFHVNSGYRTIAQNFKDGGKPDSAHLKGKAADIAAPTSHEKYCIINAAIRHGITRIGYGKTFIHLDADATLPQEVIWTY
jgi:zinc D-Ala-D-Ala carboxypeptidase